MRSTRRTMNVPHQSRPDTPDGAARAARYLLCAGLFLLPVVFSRELGAPDLLPKRGLVYLLALGLALTWFATARSRTARRRSATDLVVPAVAYALWAVVSAIWAGSPFSVLVEGMQLVLCVLLFAALQVLVGPDDIPVVARWSTAGGALLAAYGIGQYFGFDPLGIPSVGLPSGTFVFRNLAASYLVAALPLGVLSILTVSDGGRRMLWAAGTGLMLLLLLYTRTRGAWLGAGAACAVTAGLIVTVPGLRRGILDAARKAWTERGFRAGLVVVFSVCAIAAFLPARTDPSVIQRFDEQKSSAVVAARSLLTAGSDRGRFAMWWHTFRMWRDHPFLGVGLDNWEYVYPRYDTGETSGKITGESEPVRPHNDVLWILSELGIVGLGLYLWLLAAAWRCAHRVLRSGPANRQLLVLAAIAGTVGLLVHGLFSFPKEQPATAALFWFHLGLIALASTSRTRVRSRFAARALVPALAAAVAVAGLGLTWRQVRFDRGYQEARAMAAHGEWDRAAARMDRAIRNGDFDHRARFLKARYLQHAGRLAEAEAAYRSALQVHPNYAHSRHNLGGVLAAEGKWSDAIASYRKALEIRPGYEQARLNLGYALAASGRLPEAEAEFREVLRHDPQSAPALGNLGAVYLQAGHTKEAIECLEQAVRLRPGYAEAYNNLGYALEAEGDTEAAIKAYRALLDLWRGERREGVAAHIAALQAKRTNGN